MRDFFRALAIILFAAIASAGLVLALIFVTQRLTVQSLTPAHFVPHSKVIAYIDTPTEQLTMYIAEWIPSFELNTDTGAEAIVLADIDTDLASIQFIRDSLSTSGPYKAIASSSGAMALVGESTESLQTHKDYIALLSEVPAQTPWVFMRLDAIEDSLLSEFQEQGYTALGLWMTEREVHVHLVGPVHHATTSISPLLPVPDNGIMSIRTTNGMSTWKRITENLDETNGLITNQLIQKRISSLFGPRIDFQFHILPLLEQSGALHLQKNMSGGILFALEGRAPKESIDRLHDGFADTLPKTRVVQRLFDERFPSTDVRIDPSMITDETVTVGGWNIRTTGHRTESRKFFSARNGQMFIISNGEDLLQELILSDKPSIQLPTGPSLKRSSMIAGGIVDMNTGLNILSTYVPSLEIPLLSPLVSHLSGSVVWSMEQKTGLTSLILRQQ